MVGRSIITGSPNVMVRQLGCIKPVQKIMYLDSPFVVSVQITGSHPVQTQKVNTIRTSSIGPVFGSKRMSPQETPHNPTPQVVRHARESEDQPSNGEAKAIATPARVLCTSKSPNITPERPCQRMGSTPVKGVSQSSVIDESCSWITATTITRATSTIAGMTSSTFTTKHTQASNCSYDNEQQHHGPKHNRPCKHCQAK